MMSIQILELAEKIAQSKARKAQRDLKDRRLVERRSEARLKERAKFGLTEVEKEEARLVRNRGYRKKYYDKNRDTLTANTREYYRREDVQKRIKESRRYTTDEYRAYRKDYRKKRMSAFRQYARDYYARHREQVLAKRHERYLKNKENKDE